MGKIARTVRRHHRRWYFQMFAGNRKRLGLMKTIWLLIKGQWGLTANSFAVQRMKLAVMSKIRRIQGRQVDIVDDIKL